MRVPCIGRRARAVGVCLVSFLFLTTPIWAQSDPMTKAGPPRLDADDPSAGPTSAPEARGFQYPELAPASRDTETPPSPSIETEPEGNGPYPATSPSYGQTHPTATVGTQRPTGAPMPDRLFTMPASRGQLATVQSAVAALVQRLGEDATKDLSKQMTLLRKVPQPRLSLSDFADTFRVAVKHVAPTTLEQWRKNLPNSITSDADFRTVTALGSSLPGAEAELRSAADRIRGLNATLEALMPLGSAPAMTRDSAALRDWQASVKATYAALKRGIGDVLQIADVLRSASVNSVRAAMKLHNPPIGGTTTVFYGTTRNAVSNLSEGISYGTTNEAGADGKVHFGMFTATLPDTRCLGNEVSGSAIRPTTLATDLWLAAVDSKVSSRGVVLVYVHGYNNSFASAAGSAAQLAWDLRFPDPTILFSWPSVANEEGPFDSYKTDERAMRDSIPALIGMLDQIRHLRRVRTVHVLAHSMGAECAMSALASMSYETATTGGRFGEVVFCAPRIGITRFLSDLETVRSRVKRLSVYASATDLALQGGKAIDHEELVGLCGLPASRIRGFDVVDCSFMPTDWLSLRHAYYRDNRSVLADLSSVLSESALAEERFGLFRDWAAAQWVLAP